MKEFIKCYKQMIIVSLVAVIIGVIVGAIDAGFGKILIYLGESRSEHFMKLIFFLPLAGMLLILIYRKVSKKAMKGMNLVFNVGHGEEDSIPLTLVPLSIIGTWMTHLFGGSAGREGVAVQIGATVSHYIGSRIKIENASRVFLVTGMAAGFAGLFGTPIAACFFSLEVLIAGALDYTALLPIIIAAFSSSFTAHLLNLEKFTFKLETKINIDAMFILKLVIIAVIFSFVGRIFSVFLKYAKEKLGNKFEDPIKKIFVVGIILSILFIICGRGRYSGLGTNLINASFNGEHIYEFDWLLKIILTVITLAAGYQGGEVTPLFSIGCSLGVVLANILNMPVEFIAALGYTAVFGSATNTLLAPIFIGAEVFGYEYMPYFFVVCSISYIFNGNKSIYGLQKNIIKAPNKD